MTFDQDYRLPTIGHPNPEMENARIIRGQMAKSDDPHLSALAQIITLEQIVRLDKLLRS